MNGSSNQNGKLMEKGTFSRKILDGRIIKTLRNSIMKLPQDRNC